MLRSLGCWLLLWALPLLAPPEGTGAAARGLDVASYRERVRAMFYHAYEHYLQSAFPYDELRPLTCDGQDTWGSFSLTLIDALDTLLILGNVSEFQRVVSVLQEGVDFDIDVNASVFETNIRVVGGLLSAHLLSKKAGIEVEAGWPCSGPLLRMAEEAARKLLPAFQTPTGMPYGTVNLLHGVNPGETPVTCTAGIGTFIVEFATLSHLTGDPVFEDVARKALKALWKNRSDIGLVGNHIDVITAKWVAQDAGIGAGVDSYFEYLVKGAILLQDKELMSMFLEYNKAIKNYTKFDDWYLWVQMYKGTVSMPVFQSLEAYWPGLQSLIGDIDNAMRTFLNYYTVWKQFGGLPEFYNIPQGYTVDKREGYPLRPELIESAMYLYRATGDPTLLELGRDAVESIEKISKVDCGFATIKDLRDHRLDNRMESFFLAETVKYLYLLFDPDNFIHNDGSAFDVVITPFGECVLNAGGYVFNTEAHPIDPAALHCCRRRKEEQWEVEDLMREFYSLKKSRKFTFKRTFDQSDGETAEAPEDAPSGEGGEKRNSKKNSHSLLSCPSQSFNSKLAVLGQEGFSSCEEFLYKNLPLWDGFCCRSQVLRLLSWIPLSSFSEMKSHLYDPLAQLFFTSSLYFKCSVLESLRELLQNWLNWHVVHLDSEDDSQAHSLNTTLSGQVNMVAELVHFVGWASTAALHLENNSSLLMHFILDFYETVCDMYLKYDLPLLILPPAGVFYPALLSMDSVNLNQLCYIMYRYRTNLVAAKENEQSKKKILQFKFSSQTYQEYNQYLTAMVGCLWTSSVFQKDTHPQGLCMDDELLKKTAVQEFKNSFNIVYHPAMMGYAVFFMKQAWPDDRTFNFSLIKGKRWNWYLEYLYAQGLSGLKVFIESSINRISQASHSKAGSVQV